MYSNFWNVFRGITSGLRQYSGLMALIRIVGFLLGLFVVFGVVAGNFVGGACFGVVLVAAA